MAVGTAAAIGAGIGALGGGLSAGLGGHDVPAQSQYEYDLFSKSFSDYGQLQDFANRFQAAVGSGIFQENVNAQRAVSNELQNLYKTGGVPQTQDINQAQGFAASIFAPQTLQLQQLFQQQGINAQRQNALLGFGGTDTVLQRQLADQQGRQQALLNAQQGSLAAQYAQQLPQQRLGFLQQNAGVLGNLQQQAFQNRQTLLGLGNQMANQERSSRYGQEFQAEKSKPTFGSVLGGVTGGLGAGFGLGNQISNTFSEEESPSASPYQSALGGTFFGRSIG